MTYETSVTHEWANEAKTTVKRTRVDYPANLTELQTAIDEVIARMAELPEPEPYPTQAEYEKKWADTTWNYEQVCRMVDLKNADNPNVQERLQLGVSVERLAQDIINWRAKVADSPNGEVDG